ncbi:alpha/beta fold hydrolase [Streptomyces cyaneofuscatus]|uniref:alpha/beta fold hydrolase n=1 Tax=Streptomyces cyaneofuscatus TaxID=66883 RepID=UPI0037B1E9A1
MALDWRVTAPDRRGHGESDRPGDCHRRGHLADAVAVLGHLGLGPVAVLGHSPGGVNAYQLAAHHPDQVRALIVEGIGAVVEDGLSFCLSWPHRAPDRETLVAELGASARCLGEAIRAYDDGWWPAFRPEDMAASQRLLTDDHWNDWLPTECGSPRSRCPPRHPLPRARPGHDGPPPTHPPGPPAHGPHGPRDRS